MNKLTELHLVALGFERNQETGESTYWHYYTLDIGDICLITNDNEHAGVNGWLVYIFDKEEVVFKTEEETAQLVRLLKSNQI